MNYAWMAITFLCISVIFLFYVTSILIARCKTMREDIEKLYRLTRQGGAE